MFLDLNPNLTSEQRSLKEQVHKFAAEVMRPAADKLDKMAEKYYNTFENSNASSCSPYPTECEFYVNN